MPTTLEKRGDEEWLLAIRVRQFGDVLAALEALRAMKAHRPERQIAYVAQTNFHPLLESLDFIDLLLPEPPRVDSIAGARAYARYIARLRTLKPAAAIDFHGSARSALVTFFSGAPVRVGFETRIRQWAYNVVEPRGLFDGGRLIPQTAVESGLSLARHVGSEAGRTVLPEIVLDGATVDRGRAALVGSGVPATAIAAGRVVGINPGRPYQAKEWPAARFEDIARRLTAQGLHVVVMWGPGEEETAQSIASSAGSGVTLSPSFDLETMAGALQNLGGLITIDSGLKHLAVCLRVPTLSLFGSTDPGEWHMGTDHDGYLWKGLSCSPCRRLTCPFAAPCMDFDADEVMDAFAAMELRKGVS